jgi:hypothetical protein
VVSKDGRTTELKGGGEIAVDICDCTSVLASSVSRDLLRDEKATQNRIRINIM